MDPDRGLGRGQAVKKENRIAAVQKMQEYIEQHLLESITLDDIAQAAGYSRFHCVRIFKELTGKSPVAYMRALRLSKAALRLRDTRAKVIDTALDCSFDSHEGFTRAFAREFGINPLQYSKETPPVKLFLPYPVAHSLVKPKTGTPKEQGMQAIFFHVTERPKRKLIVQRGKEAQEYFAYCREVGCDIWGTLCSVKEALYEPAGFWMPERFRPAGTSCYVQGVEVPETYNGVVPEGMELIDLPPCTMMVFQGPPYDDSQFMDAVAETMTAIQQFQPETYGFAWAADDGPRLQLEPRGSRGYIEAWPVRPLRQ